MEGAISVCVDKGCLRVIGEIPVTSGKEDLEAFLSEISLKLLGDKKMPKLPSFGLTKKELTETDAAIYIGRSKSFLRKCRMEGNVGKHQRGPKYTRDSARCGCSCKFPFLSHSSFCKTLRTAATPQSVTVTTLLSICIGNTT